MDHFQTHGWVRIEGAFSAQEAAAMRDVVWRALAAVEPQRFGKSAFSFGLANLDDSLPAHEIGVYFRPPGAISWLVHLRRREPWVRSDQLEGNS